MKTIVAGLTLLLLFLIPEPSLAGSENCARDFWGKCKGASWSNGNGNGVHYASYRYRHCAKDFWGRCADGRPRWRRHRDNDNGYGHHHHVGPSNQLRQRGGTVGFGDLRMRIQGPKADAGLHQQRAERSTEPPIAQESNLHRRLLRS